MRTIDLYVLRQTLKPLAIALVVALLVLLIERMLRLLDLVLGAQGPVKVVFEIMGYLVPNYISLALPLSLLLGVMLAFNKLSRDGEIDTIQCAGVSLARQSRAALVAALGIAIITLITLGYLKPYGRYAYQSMVFAIKNAAFQAFVQAGVFTRLEDAIFLVEGKRAGASSTVFLYESNDGASTALTARNGMLLRSGDQAVPQLRLFDGVRLTVPRDAGRTEPSTGQDTWPTGVLLFQELRMTLGEGRAPVFRPRGADEREYTLTELWQRRFEPPPGVRRSDMVAEFHSRVTSVLSVLFLPIFGIPLALGRRRSDRSYGLAIGLLVLIIYNQVLDLGKNTAETGAISPVLGLWLPLLAFASASTWLFHRASSRRGDGQRLWLPLLTGASRPVDPGLDPTSALMSVLRRYVSYRFISYFALVLSALSALALTLDLMEQADRVLRSAPDGPAALLRYGALRLPDIAAQMLPMAALLGMLFTLGQLIKHRELVALWSSGVSPTGLIFAMLPVAMMLAAADFANNDIAVPQMQGALRSLGFAGERKGASSSEKIDAEWLLSGSDVIRLPEQATQDGVLRHITVFRRDADGRLTERIDAGRAMPRGDGWTLADVTRYLIEPATTSKLESLYWDGRIDLAVLPLIASDMRELGTRELIQLIEHEGYGQRPADRFRTWLHARIGSAFAPGLMMFLAISLAQRFRRAGSFGPLMLFSIGIGFVYFVVDGICRTMGEAGFLPPWFAGWGPKVALSSLVASFVSHGES